MSFQKILALTLVWAAIAVNCSIIEPQTVCEVCRRPIHGETHSLIDLGGGDQKDVCCPRCGLHFMAGREGVVQFRVADYETGVLLDSRSATFVESSSVILCCKPTPLRRDQSGGQFTLGWDRCLPSLVAFEKPEAAETFRSLHGGSLKTWEQVLEEPEFKTAKNAIQ